MERFARLEDWIDGSSPRSGRDPQISPLSGKNLMATRADQTYRVSETMLTETLPLIVPPLAVLHGDVRPDLVRDELLGEIFTATARAFPARPCMTSGTRVLSYRRLPALRCGCTGGTGGRMPGRLQRGCAPHR
jgi:hypothetical protein